MNFLQKLIAVWQKVNLVQRVVLLAVIAASAVAAALLVNWARQPDMTMLFQELQPAEASKITDKISAKAIPYELRDGGTAVYVPREQVYQLRLDLAKDGLPGNEQSGYKLFDDEKIGISPFVQNVNLKRALQDELAKSIQMVEGVLHARVHIVSPEQQLFATEEGQTSASVILRLKPGYRLNGTNIAAITHMVSGSVKGLKAEDVTIIDSEGNLLSNQNDPLMATGAGTVHDYRERVEQGLGKKVEDMLATVLGPGRATVRVSAVVDMNSVNTITETYDPRGKVATKEESKTNKEVDGAAAAAASSGGKTPAGSTKNDEVITTEYQVGKTVKQQVILPGAIKSLSVAAFVDLSVGDANATPAAGQPAMMMQVADVEQIIKTALGLKESDSLKVVNAKFHKAKDIPLEEPASAWPRYLAMASHLSLGVMALCALLVLRIFLKARNKAMAVEATATQALPGPAAPAGALMAPIESPNESLMLQRQITHALRNNPQQVREMFLSWIEDKE
jgi:flagellar M-ring protein FliF